MRKYVVAADGDVAGRAADARGCQAAVIVGIAGGQLAVIVCLQPGMAVAALQRVIAVQLDVYVPLAAGVDVQVLERHVCGLADFCVDGDGVGVRRSGDRRGIVWNINLRSLCNGLPAALGVDRNAMFQSPAKTGVS